MKRILLSALALLALSTATTLWAANDVGQYYWVLKKADYVQLSTSPPSQAGAPYQFNSVVEHNPNVADALGSGTVTPPSSGLVNSGQPYSLDALGDLTYDAFVESLGDLNKAFGTGTYNLNIKGVDDTYGPSLELATGNYPTEVPQFSNAPYDQNELVFNAATTNTLSWNSFTDGVLDLDAIILTLTEGDNTIVRVVLPATQTSYTFAAGVLHAEQSYVAEVSFVKLSGNRDTSTISGSTGFCGYATSTKVYISTSTRTPINGLGNISTRGYVGVSSNGLIPGFIITHTDSSSLKVVVRAIGPSLTSSGVTNALADPVLTLYDSAGNVLASNDDWATSSGAAEINSDGLAPSDAKESALLAELPAGSYTVAVHGKNGTTGVGLAEVYNLGSNGDAKIANISTRGQVKTTDEVLIGGVIISGPANHDALIRALGPSLANQGVSGALADPVLQLFNAEGTLIYQNNDWKDTQQSQIEATGIPPTNDLESALISTLSPANYTAIVKGKSGGTGVGLVEVYPLN